MSEYPETPELTIRPYIEGSSLEFNQGEGDYREYLDIEANPNNFEIYMSIGLGRDRDNYSTGADATFRLSDDQVRELILLATIYLEQKDNA